MLMPKQQKRLLRLVSGFLAKNNRIIVDLGMLAKGPKYPDGTKCPALKIYEEFRPIGYNVKGRL